VSHTSATNPLPAGFSRVADHWGLVVGFGVVSIVLGIVLIAWPEATLVVLVVLLAIDLLVTGVFRLISAFAATPLDGGIRALIGLTGALAILVGLLFLREPLQTVTVIGLLLGVWWTVSGIIDVFSGLFTDTGDRGWRIFMGLVSLVAGIFLLVNPTLTLSALVVVAAIWLLAYGVLALVAGFRLRQLHSAGGAAAAMGTA